MAQRGGTHIIETSTFGLENVGEEFAVVVRIGLFVNDDKEESTPVFEGLVHSMRVLIDFSQSRVFFIQVGVFRARGDACHEGQVSAAASHEFRYETPLRGRGAFLDPIERPHRVVERSIGTDCQFRTGKVVIDRGRNQNDRDAERRVAIQFSRHFLNGEVSVQTANHQERIDLITLDRTAQCVVLVDGGNRATSAQFSTTLESPTFNVFPRQFTNLVICQAGP